MCAFEKLRQNRQLYLLTKYGEDELIGPLFAMSDQSVHSDTIPKNIPHSFDLCHSQAIPLFVVAK